MQHMMIPATFRTKDGLSEAIRSHEQDGWSVAAMGPALAGLRLVFVKDGHSYEHEVIGALWKTPEQIAELIAEREPDGWGVCAIGQCFGSTLLILKRQRQ